MNRRRRRSSLIAVFFTYLVDSLSWSVVFPVFAPYFLDPQNVLFSPDVSASVRTTILGVFLMAFSLGQFLGAPLIGDYADKHGRKKALTVSVFFTFLGLVLSAWSMGGNHLFWLFVGRLMTGIFAGTSSVCLSAVSDLSDSEETKGKNFGYMAMIAGIGFVFGAFVGGKLADPSFSSEFSPDLPLWLASALTVINFLIVLFGFEETSSVRKQVKYDLFEGFKNVKIALRSERVQEIYIVYFFFLVAWAILFQFFPVLTVQNFEFTSSNIGDLALFMGACWAIGAGYLNKVLVEQFNRSKILDFCLIGFTIFCGLIIVPKHIYGVLPILGLCVIFGAVAWPLCTHLISNSAPKEMQGKILGLSQSVQSLASAVGPVLGGLAVHVSIQFTFLLASTISLIAGIFYYFVLKHR